VAKILVIDDDSVARRQLSRIVISIGHETAYSTGGLSALETVFDHDPDLMLLDLTTPLYDGVDTLNLLLGNLLTRAVPLVMIAAITDRERVLTGMGAGAVDYIEKPVSAVDLELAIQRYLPSTDPVGEFSGHRAIRSTNSEKPSNARAA
jgi:CheY-like chemotaxis protein